VQKKSFHNALDIKASSKVCRIFCSMHNGTSVLFQTPLTFIVQKYSIEVNDDRFFKIL